MLGKITSLVSAIEEYKVISETGETNSLDVRTVVGGSMQAVWEILWKNGVTLSKVLDSIETYESTSIDEYRARRNAMQISFDQWSFWGFSKEFLILFGISDPEMFILRGKISPIIHPILQTKIRMNLLLKDETKNRGQNLEKWIDLEWLPTVISAYNPVYEALIDKSNGIHSIIQDELILPLAESAPCILKQYGKLITLYEKKSIKIFEIEKLKRKIINLNYLKRRWMTNDIARIESFIWKKYSELELLIKKINEVNANFSLDDIGIFIYKRLWDSVKWKTWEKINSSTELITANKIRWKIRRSISVWIHRKYAILRKIRINSWGMYRMIKIYDKLIIKYLDLLKGIIDTEKKREIIAQLKEELDNWESESNELLDMYSLADIRRLRDQIIEEFLSKK